MLRFAFLLCLSGILGCGSVQKMDSSSTDTIAKDAIETLEQAPGVTEATKKSISSSIEILRKEIQNRDKLIASLQEELEVMGRQYEKLQEQFAEAQRDAGKGDGLIGLGYWILGILGFLLLFFILYLILKGKFRIPGLVG